MSPHLPDVDGPQTVKPAPDSPFRRTIVTPPPASEQERDLERARLTVTLQVGHQQVGSEPFILPPVAFQRWLDSKEQTWTRHTRAGEEWQPLVGKECWLVSASFLAVRNEEGIFRHRVPTEEERQRVASLVLEVGLAVPSGAVVPLAEVPPCEVLPGFRPVDLSALRVRCRAGTARYCVTLIPR